MNPIPLSKKYLQETINMTGEIFPNDVNMIYNPDRSFTLGLDVEENPELLNTRGLSRIGYWILVNEKDEVIAVTGLYRVKDQPEDTVWLGWYGIRADNRGKGLGRELLEWTMKKAKEEGYKKLKLYTSTDPNEARAQDLYEKLGLKVVGEEEGEGEYKTLYREVVL